MINIIVCVKQVLDPELPVSLFKVNPETKKVILPRGRSPVLSPFDENALEAALKIKDNDEAKITVISMGSGLDEMVLRQTIASGADELILLDDDSFQGIDSYSTAKVLTAAIKKNGTYDLVICGRQAADTNAGQVGIALGDTLGIPVITLCGQVEVTDGKLKLERMLEDGSETIESKMPAVVTVGYEIGDIREGDFEAEMRADDQEITIWDSQDLEIDSSELVSDNLIELAVPEGGVECNYIEGGSPDEIGEKLAITLKDKQII